ncbi:MULTISPECIES: RraA family protein [unclassified Cupriavidus]|jgi:4-hydroxy-4-methyl-2-oxoglutarate aldolase|uniref:RraA family protein n=1 Tax=unclassified Cupriavidus TaxID=2640874 RepID=UPI001C000700|nr:MULTISPECIES: RraA family protein [unclassified Cupriavidus]MCA3186661.1 RraA family protein [Cupriavidus sp.]MCA3189568.1 RraA family protein [Cupriavidus sp.]MCA3195648.1 RraA family protein [Cupriavidus sp.]MCA3201203.1 RraA family protein [Cupriavidus sp.]MCA3208253.1 RraA family protein [Cupriavidus sp.]
MSTQAKASPAIRRDVERVSPELVARASKFQAAILADVVGRRGTLNARVQGLSPAMKVCGPALTVEVRPGDNLMFHVALAIAEPGDVIIVDGKGDQTAALCGEIMATQAQASGVAGFVIDAAVRDSHELGQGAFPVFSAGTNPCGPTKAIGGLVNWPASVAGVAVNPGDLIVGDADGVVVIPREDVPVILELAQKKVDAEARRIAAIKAGDLRPGWLDKELRAAGVLAEGESL